MKTFLLKVVNKGPLKLSQLIWGNVLAKNRKELSEKYLGGSGIEIGALHSPLWLKPGVAVQYVDRFDGEGLHQHYPERAASGFVNHQIIDDGEKLTQFQDSSLDFIVANHFIEHCENPL